MEVKMPTAEMVDMALLKPYKKNTKRHNQTQIDNVAESIRKFGFVQPFVIDKNNEVVIGHCRLLAAQKLGIKELPKYSYPLNVVTAPQLGIYSRLGIEFGFNADESKNIACLDNQKEAGKAIYGSGYLISENKRAERERAGRERAERWELSEREKRIIATLK